MHGTELAPLFIGVATGLILGAFLYLFWVRRYRHKSARDDGNADIPFNLSSLESAPPYHEAAVSLVEMLGSHEDLSSELPTVDPALESDTKTPLLPLPPSLSIPSDFKPPDTSVVIDRYSTPIEKSSHLKSHLSLDEWGRSLKGIHHQVYTSHNIEGDLADEAWLNMGVESSSAKSQAEQTLTQPSPATFEADTKSEPF